MKSNISKLIFSLLLALMTLGLMVFALPVAATVNVDWPEPVTNLMLPVFPDPDIQLTPGNSGGADIDINSDGSMVAMVYYKLSGGSSGGVYLKGADATVGWRTVGPLGYTSFPPRVAFAPDDSTVHVVWIDYDATTNKDSVRHAQCTIYFEETRRPSCTVFNTIYGPISTGNLNSPDVAVDSNGRVHIVWENNGSIQSKHSGQSWSTSPVSISPPSGGKFSKPVLAASPGFMHLAFSHDTSTADGKPDEIRYRQSSDGVGNSLDHSWGGEQAFGLGIAVPSTFDTFDNPTIVANSSGKVSVAWEAHKSAGTHYYALMEANSNVWLGEYPRYITTTFEIDIAVPADDRLSYYGVGSPNPAAVNGLQPSLALSGTERVIVWQQRPAIACLTSGSIGTQADATGNATSEIYYAYTTTTWIDVSMVADTSAEYSIDPDIAVHNGVRHIVYAKNDASAICDPGNRDKYAVYYYGPFQILTNDTGEGGVFLPIILK